MNPRFYAIVGHSTFLVMFIFSLFYVLERNLYADSAAYIFQIINTENLAPQHGRYAAILTQILPVVGVKIGLSITGIFYLYSISFILFFYGIWLIIHYGLKHPTAGILLLLILIIPVRENFYKPVTEVHQALAWSVLLFAWLDQKFKQINKSIINKVSYFLIAALIILLCYFSHPVSAFTIGFIIVWILIDKKSWNHMPFYGLIILTVILFGHKVFQTDLQSYEGEKYQGMFGFVHSLPKLFSYYSWNYVQKVFLKLFLIPSILLGLVLCHMIIRKAWFKTSYIFLSVVGYLIILLISFANGDSDIMMEKNFMSLSFFIFLPFTKDIISSKSYNSVLKLIIICFLMIQSFYGIINQGKLYQKRIEYLASIIDFAKNNDIQKIAADIKNLKENLILIRWAFPVETLMLSSIESPEQGITVYPYCNFTEVENDFDDPNRFFYVPWGIHKVSELNTKYFNVPKDLYSNIDYKLE